MDCEYTLKEGITASEWFLSSVNLQQIRLLHEYMQRGGISYGATTGIDRGTK